MVEVGKILLMQTLEIAVRKNREVKNWWFIEDGSVGGDCEIILWTSKDGIGQRKIVEVEDFGWRL